MLCNTHLKQQGLQHTMVCCGMLCYCTAGMAGVSQQHTGMFPALLLLVDQISEPGVVLASVWLGLVRAPLCR